MIEFEIPLRLKSIANGNQMSHWAKSKLKRHHHGLGLLYTRNARANARGMIEYPLEVTIKRIGKRTMDDDNLASAAKYLRDGIAEALGIDDGDRTKVKWEYAQEIGKEYGVRIVIK